MGNKYYKLGKDPLTERGRGTLDFNMVPDPPLFRLSPDASDYISHQSQLAWDSESCVPNSLPFLGNKPWNPVLLLRMKLRWCAGRGATLPKAGLRGANTKDKRLRWLLTLCSVFATGTLATLGTLNSSLSSIAPPCRARCDQLFSPRYRRRLPPSVCHGRIQPLPPYPSKPFAMPPSFSEPKRSRWLAKSGPA